MQPDSILVMSTGRLRPRSLPLASSSQFGGDAFRAVSNSLVFSGSPAAAASSSMSTVTQCHSPLAVFAYTEYRFAMLTAELGRP